MNHVFVDFENVPSVDLALIRGRDADVTLLIGEKQRRLEIDFVRQIHAFASQVTLIEVGGSGRNALDMVLAWHLGRTAERCPQDAYFVVSKDRDFDPLIKHLRARGLEAARVDGFASLPFIAAPEREQERGQANRRRRPAAVATETPPAAVEVAPAQRPARSRGRHPREHAAPPQSVPTTQPEANARLAKLIDRLQHKTKARPVRRKTLLSHINGFFGNQLTPDDLEAVVAALVIRGVIRIDDRGRVEYDGENADQARPAEMAPRRPRATGAPR